MRTIGVLGVKIFVVPVHHAGRQGAQSIMEVTAIGQRRESPAPIAGFALALALALALSSGMFASAAAHAAENEDEELSSALADTEFREPERVVMVRFARAFGRLSRDHEPDALIHEDAVDEEALRSELAENRLDEEHWHSMLAAMRENEAFRNRVETLSSVYRLGE